MSTARTPLFLLLAAALVACGNDDNDHNDNKGETSGNASVLDTPTAAKAGGAEPERIVVDHILIGVKSTTFPSGRRNAADARKVAYELLGKLKNGADWASLKREYSEDPPPGGPYPMSNRGVMPHRGEIPRDKMVQAFGDVGFKLDVGEIAIADYTPNSRRSPYGYHIIKRVK